MTPVRHGDAWIAMPQGGLFARAWRSPNASTGSDKAPLVLFHDSLGCAELWRDFPAILSST